MPSTNVSETLSAINDQYEKFNAVTPPVEDEVPVE